MIWSAASAGREEAHLGGERAPAPGAFPSGTSDLHVVYAARIGLVLFA